jgi:hypothetical protein
MSIVGNLPAGNYSWTAKGGGIDRNGTLVIDGYRPFSVTFDGTLTVSGTLDLNVSLSRAGQQVGPSKIEKSGVLQNITYGGAIGECILTISSQDQVLFFGGYDITGRSGGGPFSAMSMKDAPEYVKYNQLINPDSAMTGYEQVLDPSADVSITAADGATAMAIFFGVFLTLGILVFSKMEMA